MSIPYKTQKVFNQTVKHRVEIKLEDILSDTEIPNWARRIMVYTPAGPGTSSESVKDLDRRSVLIVEWEETTEVKL